MAKVGTAAGNGPDAVDLRGNVGLGMVDCVDVRCIGGSGMSYVAIPTEVFDSPEYLALKTNNREFLIRLYALFGDCDQFTVNYKTPAEYGDADSSTIRGKLAALVRAGLVLVASSIEREGCGRRQRVLQFKYSAVAAY